MDNLDEAQCIHLSLELCPYLQSNAQGGVLGGGGMGEGHEATETRLAYAPVSQAHGHNHIVQCFACCTAA